MRARLSLLLLSMALAFLLLVPTQGACEEARLARPCEGEELPLAHVNLTALVQRRAYLNYTLLILEDNLTIRATGEATLDSFLYGIPQTWARKSRARIMYYEFLNATSGKPLSAEEEELGGLDLRGFLVSFPTPLGLDEGDEVQIHVKLVLNGSLIAEEPEAGEFIYRVESPMYPVTSLEISNATFRLELPVGSTITKTEPENLERRYEKGIWVIHHSALNLTSFSSEVASVKFKKSPPLPFFYCRRAIREVVIRPFGGLRITDTYELRSENRGDLEYVVLILPAKASAVKVSDLMGPLRIKTAELHGARRITVTLRGLLKTGDPLTLRISYDLPWPEHVVEESPTEFTLRLTAQELLLWPVEHLFIKVVLPDGARLLNSTPAPDHVARRALGEEVGFSLPGPLAPFGEDVLVVRFSYSVFCPSFWPVLWAGLGAILVCLVVKLLAVPAPLPVLPVPVEKLMEFIRAYERKFTLMDERSSLREAREEGRISREKYRRRVRAINRELAELDKRISSLIPELREAGGLVAEMVSNIEKAESQLESVERDIRNLRARYLRKEIGKRAYEDLLRECRRREDRARTTIREALLRLRELVA